MELVCLRPVEKFVDDEPVEDDRVQDDPHQQHQHGTEEKGEVPVVIPHLGPRPGSGRLRPAGRAPFTVSMRRLIR